MEHEVARRRIVFLTSLFLLPTPVFVFFCFGWIPVGLQVALALRWFGWASPFLLPSALLSGGLQYWIARSIARRTSARSARVLCVVMLVLGSIPMFMFDCMDGHRTTLCNAYSMYYELVSERDACGDVW